MPPAEKSEVAKLRYFTRLIAAIVTDHGKAGELRVKKSTLDRLNGEPSRQALFEDFDTRRDELVLRFGSKLSAVYPFEGDGATCQNPKQQPAQPSTTSTAPDLFPLTSEPTTFPPQSRPPLSDAELAAAERKAKQILAAVRIRKERQQSSSL